MAETKMIVPTWVLTDDASTNETLIRNEASNGGMSAERLTQYRNALAVMADRPLVTLEAYYLPVESSSLAGKTIPATAPLATGLSSLLQQSSASISKAAPSVAKALDGGGETLYRMVVPAATAAKMGAGAARSMSSFVVPGAIHGGILGANGLIGQASFVKVSGGTAAVAGGAAAAVTAGTIVAAAAPLVLIALATAATVYTEEQKRRALARIESAIGDWMKQAIHNEFDSLNASSHALEKAAVLLLDEGRISHSAGLDSAVHAIDTAVESAKRNVKDWTESLAEFNARGATPSNLKKAFPGIADSQGEFRARLRMAAFAIAMKRRLAVLQAVEHAQLSPEKSLDRFVSYMDEESQRIEALEGQLRNFLHDLGRVLVRPPSGVSNKFLTRGEAKDLLQWSGRLRQIDDQESPDTLANGDLELILVRKGSGALTLVSSEAVA